MCALSDSVKDFAIGRGFAPFKRTMDNQMFIYYHRTSIIINTISLIIYIGCFFFLSYSLNADICLLHFTNQTINGGLKYLYTLHALFCKYWLSLDTYINVLKLEVCWYIFIPFPFIYFYFAFYYSKYFL